MLKKRESYRDYQLRKYREYVEEVEKRGPEHRMRELEKKVKILENAVKWMKNELAKRR